MDTSKVKALLSTEDIIRLVTEGLGSNGNLWDSSGAPIFQTICHNPPGFGSYKLYYYPDSQTFYCYTECGSMDVFELVQKAKGFESFLEAYKYVINFFHLDVRRRGFADDTEKELSDDWNILNKYDFYQKVQKPDASLPILPTNILQCFGPLASPMEWKAEHITAETMRKFGIRVDIANQKIIIPHYDMDGNLVGIRGRSYDTNDLLDGRKYMPAYLEGTCYRHPLGSCLYGLHENLEAIKKHKKIMLVESEKSVMQCYGYYGENCFVAATCGSSISPVQIDLLLKLGVEEVILAYDRENDTNPESEQTREYEQKLLKVVLPLTKYMNVYIVMDYEGLLPPKGSPSDMGQETLEKLMKKKIYIPSPEVDFKKERRRATKK